MCTTRAGLRLPNGDFVFFFLSVCYYGMASKMYKLYKCIMRPIREGPFNTGVGGGGREKLVGDAEKITKPPFKGVNKSNLP